MLDSTAPLEMPYQTCSIIYIQEDCRPIGNRWVALTLWQVHSHNTKSGLVRSTVGSSKLSLGVRHDDDVVETAPRRGWTASVLQWCVTLKSTALVTTRKFFFKNVELFCNAFP